MNFEPFDVMLAAKRLREQIPQLTSVAGVAEFSQVKDLRGFRTPSAYVLQAVEKPGVNGPRGARVQPAQTNFGVAIAVNNYRSEMDASTTDELRSIVGAVRTALIGWTPPVPGVTPIGWIGGEVVDFDDNALLFIDSYQLTNLLQK